MAGARGVYISEHSIQSQDIAYCNNVRDNYFRAVMEEILSQINSPADLRKLSEEDLPQLCQEIREYLIDNLSRNPGHFASSMGAVEMTVALHYVFNTPDDRIVWDVGHQAYTHKIITGRREAFKTQRTLGGIAGFPSPLESKADTFMAGHASNSISAALGMAIADKNTHGAESRKTVAVIGDAAISGGLAFEGLNNAANVPNDLLIILNDNEMSIDDNVGALHRYLTELNTTPSYNRMRDRIYRGLRKRDLITDIGKGLILRFNNSMKALLSRRQNIFEGLNIRYFGPFDGHDVRKLVRILRDIRDMKGPRLLHIHTIKGKGFPEAEKNPAAWHAPGKFNPANGEKIKPSTPSPAKWQDIFGDEIVKMASRHDDIVGITAAMPTGTSISRLMEKMPDRTFDVGISEGHAVTFAGGLATGGKHPFVAIYSSFLQRAYDNIINDICIQGLPVTFCIDRAGIVGEDGVTHHGMFDMAYLRAIPNMTVAAPIDARSLRALMHTAYRLPSPMAIRYPRGSVPETIITDEEMSAGITPENAVSIELPVGHGRAIRHTGDADIAILSIGHIGAEAAKAQETLAKEGIRTHLYDMVYLKPIDRALLDKIASGYRHVITVEDGTLAGGLSSAVAEHFSSLAISPSLTPLGIKDHWVCHGSVAQLREREGIDAASIVQTAREAAKSSLS